jgi:hypothetical protein
MTQEQANELKAMSENLANSLQGVLSMAHMAIKEVAKDNPEQADELLRDLSEAQQAKDMSQITNLMNKYANYSK